MTHMRQRRHRRCLLGLPTLLAGALLTGGCSSGSASGPLGTLLLAGQPSFTVVSGVVAPGQPQDGEAYVVNSASTPVTITSVTAIDVPGAPAAHLAEVALQAGTHPVGGQRGWPPDGVQVKSAIGAQLPHGQSGIVYAITGMTIGRDYAIAGLRVSYTIGGHAYIMLAWSGDMACVEANSYASSPTCDAFYNTVNAAIEKISGLT